VTTPGVDFAAEGARVVIDILLVVREGEARSGETVLLVRLRREVVVPGSTLRAAEAPTARATRC